MNVVEVSRSILSRAAHPRPTSLDTVDAIHLATAQLWKEQTNAELQLATHDTALAVAARATGLSAIGV
jgi:predicted nucleic acid-binding protein